MSNLKLAEQLKKAGFPQKEFEIFGVKSEPDEDQCYFPDLSELIEACGNNFAKLSRGTAKIDAPWTASGFPIKIGFRGQGHTPEIAVSLLWLEINKNEYNENK